jgi:pimeloyl-ACP methyl ester carboxylesterase
VAKKYFEYRISGANGQSAKEFISQVNSIRNFDGQNIYRSLAKTKIRVYVIWGSEDRLFDVQHQEYIRHLLPQSEFKPFAKIGHMLHLETPTALAEEIRTIVF